MLSKQIREHKKANPQLTAKQIAATLNTSAAYVYQVLAYKKNKKVKNAKKETMPVAPTEGQQVLRKELDRLHALIANMQMLQELNDLEIEEKKVEIEQLSNDIIGYRAVISYLQGQLDGVTV